MSSEIDKLKISSAPSKEVLEKDEELRKQLEESQQQLQKVIKEKEEIQSKYDALKIELDSHLKKKENYEGQIKQLQDEIDKLKNVNPDDLIKEENNKMKKQLEDLQTQMDEELKKRD